ncbi:recombinase family protein, partial [Acinetobacter terrae]|uniref:recombinase family protein n=2 Tax=Acinetobacter TaxID=469 RepID=UPI001488293D
MKGQKVGYVRVSSVEQNTGRQLEGIEVDRIFVDRASGKNTDRSKFQEMLNYVREGDRVVVHSMDRF